MYDPRKDQELVDIIQARLAVLNPDAEPYEDDGQMTWLLLLGDELPDNLSAYEAQQAGYNVVDVSFEITSGEEAYGEEGGYAIGWIACRPGGEILAQCQPYNYTGRVWTEDKDELWYRAESVIDSLLDYEKEICNG